MCVLQLIQRSLVPTASAFGPWCSSHFLWLSAVILAGTPHIQSRVPVSHQVEPIRVCPPVSGGSWAYLCESSNCYKVLLVVSVMYLTSIFCCFDLLYFTIFVGNIGQLYLCLFLIFYFELLLCYLL